MMSQLAIKLDAYVDAKQDLAAYNKRVEDDGGVHTFSHYHRELCEAVTRASDEFFEELDRYVQTKIEESRK